jgi:WhiB family transcriptional regulator, redox-sensing transcriptional regulator
MTVVSKALKPVYDKWEWQYDGACRDTDPEQFFLEPNMRGLNKRNREVAAIKICNTCPVKQACLDHALSVPEIFGVWGGMTEEDRLEILKMKGFKVEYIRV